MSVRPPPSSTLVLLAADRAGWANLTRLVTAGRRRCDKGEAVVAWSEVCEHAAKDRPRAEVTREKTETTVRMAGIGYGYDLEELGQAMMIPGTNLTGDRAAAARRSTSRVRVVGRA